MAEDPAFRARVEAKGEDRILRLEGREDEIPSRTLLR